MTIRVTGTSGPLDKGAPALRDRGAAPLARAGCWHRGVPRRRTCHDREAGAGATFPRSGLTAEV
ncbi:hypothetical protein B1808_03285 [Pseudofulvimonas gallinarii]|nr:hypothetical protein B1808_03285 [Pseudofulvimonas gallinarii]